MKHENVAPTGATSRRLPARRALVAGAALGLALAGSHMAAPEALADGGPSFAAARSGAAGEARQGALPDIGAALSSGETVDSFEGSFDPDALSYGPFAAGEGFCSVLPAGDGERGGSPVGSVWVNLNEDAGTGFESWALESYIVQDGELYYLPDTEGVTASWLGPVSDPSVVDEYFFDRSVVGSEPARFAYGFGRGKALDLLSACGISPDDVEVTSEEYGKLSPFSAVGRLLGAEDGDMCDFGSRYRMDAALSLPDGTSASVRVTASASAIAYVADPPNGSDFRILSVGSTCQVSLSVAREGEALMGGLTDSAFDDLLTSASPIDDANVYGSPEVVAEARALSGDADAAGSSPSSAGAGGETAGLPGERDYYAYGAGGEAYVLRVGDSSWSVESDGEEVGAGEVDQWGNLVAEGGTDYGVEDPVGRVAGAQEGDLWVKTGVSLRDKGLDAVMSRVWYADGARARAEAGLPAGGAATAPDDAVPADDGHVVTDYFSLDVPEYWRGKVVVSGPDEHGMVTVAPADYPDMPLAILSVADSASTGDAGDIFSSRVRAWDDGAGHRVELRVRNYYYLAQAGQGPDVPDEELARLVDLSTGGALSLDEARAWGRDGDGATDGLCFYETVLAPAVSVAGRAEPRSALMADLPDDLPAPASSADAAGLVVPLPEGAQPAEPAIPGSASWGWGEGALWVDAVALPSASAPSRFPLIAHRLARSMGGQVVRHEASTSAAGLPLDTYTVELGTWGGGSFHPTGYYALTFASLPSGGASLLMCSTGGDGMGEAAARAQATIEGLAASAQAPAAPSEQGYHDALAGCWSRLGDYDARLGEAAASFNGLWASEDLSARQEASRALSALQADITCEFEWLACSDVPAGSAYRACWEELRTLLDDLRMRAQAIKAGWDKSLDLGADAASSPEEVLAPLEAYNDEDGISRYKKDFDARYPGAQPPAPQGGEGTAGGDATDEGTGVPADGAIADGTYTGEAEGMGGPVPVTVTVSDGRIVAVEVGENSETLGIGSKAIEQLPPKIVEAGTTEGVDAISGATITSKAILAAVDQALGAVSAADDANAEAVSAAAGPLVDGTYEGSGKGMGGTVPVTVTISGGGIVDVRVGDHSETKGIGSKAIEQLPPRIVEANGTEGVDAVSGATITSQAIFDAVEEALGYARAGS